MMTFPLTVLLFRLLSLPNYRLVCGSLPRDYQKPHPGQSLLVHDCHLEAVLHLCLQVQAQRHLPCILAGWVPACRDIGMGCFP